MSLDIIIIQLFLTDLSQGRGGSVSFGVLQEGMGVGMGWRRLAGLIISWGRLGIYFLY